MTRLNRGTAGLMGSRARVKERRAVGEQRLTAQCIKESMERGGIAPWVASQISGAVRSRAEQKVSQRSPTND